MRGTAHRPPRSDYDDVISDYNNVISDYGV